MARRSPCGKVGRSCTAVHHGSLELGNLRSLRQIVLNWGTEGAVVAEQIKKSPESQLRLQRFHEEYEDLIAAGVIDPTKITGKALSNATPMASLMLTTEAMVCGWLRGRGDMKGAPTSIPAHSRDSCSFTPASAVKACATQTPCSAVPGIRQVDSPATGELPDVLLYRCRRAGSVAKLREGQRPTFQCLSLSSTASGAASGLTSSMKESGFFAFVPSDETNS